MLWSNLGASVTNKYDGNTWIENYKEYSRPTSLTCWSDDLKPDLTHVKKDKETPKKKEKKKQKGQDFNSTVENKDDE